jgi:hypothetical protein
LYKERIFQGKVDKNKEKRSIYKERIFQGNNRLKQGKKKHIQGNNISLSPATTAIVSVIDRAHARNMCSSEIGEKEKNWLPRRPRGDSGVPSSGQA